MYKKIVFLLLLTSVGIGSMQAMQADEQPAKSHLLCPYPIVLYNNSDQELDVTISTDENNTVIKNDPRILKALIFGIIDPQKVAEPNWEASIDANLLSKFKSIKLEFTIQPQETLRLPAIAVHQKIFLWKKRGGVNVKSYELDYKAITDKVSELKAKRAQSPTITVHIAPANTWGFHTFTTSDYPSNITS